MISATLPPLDCSEVQPSFVERLGNWLLVFGLHLVLLYAALYLSVKNDLIDLPPSISVRLLPMLEEKKVELPAKPLPPPAKPSPPVRRPPPVQPEPVLAVNSPAPSASFIVVPQPPAPPPQPIVAPATPSLAVVAARFDADYLHNPKPVYPAISRRNGEEGRVSLKVRVSAQGEALNVAIAKSSGHDRLDTAAIDAVVRWRFVPARRGDEVVESSVIVPVTFALE